MSILDRDLETVHGDEAAIAALQTAFAAQKRAFLADPYPSYEQRMAHLGALAGMMMSNRERISKALSTDYGCIRPPRAISSRCSASPGARSMR